MKRGLGKGVFGGCQVLSSASTPPMDMSEEQENPDYSAISIIRGTSGFHPTETTQSRLSS